MIRLEFERRKRGLSQETLAGEMLYRGERIGWLEREKPSPQDVNRRFRRTLEDYFGMSLEKLLEPVE